MRAEMQALQGDLEHAQLQASRAAELQEQVDRNSKVCITRLHGGSVQKDGL